LEIKKIRIATLSIIMMFLAFAPLFVTPQVTAQASPQVSAISVSKLHAGTPTYIGPASKALIGPFKATPALVKPNQLKPSLSGSPNVIPYHNPRPGIGKAVAIPSQLSVPPVVTCQPLSAGCDSISTSAGGATGVNGLNAVDSRGLYSPPTGPGDVEPPDQGLCAGNGFVMEVNNIGELAVFNTGLARVSSDIALDSVMGLTTIPASIGGPWSSGGDIQCLYDYDNGGHWFISEIVSNSSEASGGTFAGCFKPTAEGCLEGMAVSVTPNPTGPYNVYFLRVDFNSTEPGYPYLLNDFEKIGNTRDAFLVFYDEFPLKGVGIDGLPYPFAFNAAQEWAFNKNAMELGFPVTSPFFNIVHENMGYLATPDGTCASVAACWYQVIPGQPPDPTQYDNSHGGSGFMLAPLDFFGLGDDRIAAFYWTGLSNLLSYQCATCSSIIFGGQLFSGLETYYDEGAACPASFGGPCSLAPQKAGPTPLGDVVFSHNVTDNGGCAIASNPSGVCPEGGIASNGDGFTQVSYAQSQIWGAISTLISQQYCTTVNGKCTAAFEIHVGVAYWIVGTRTFDSSGIFTLTNQAYVTAMHEDLTFPAIASGGCAGCNLRAIITFTLSGNGGPTHADKGGFYPSTAFGRISISSHGLIPSVVNIADLGMSPQDGFTEYRNFTTPLYRPRWGDYSWAIALPNSGGEIFFATNYIQYPNCADSAYAVDPSCGGTRAPFANWGTSVNVVIP
jgi:hypothetical protein